MKWGREVFLLLIQTLPTFLATWIWILIWFFPLNLQCPNPGSHISQDPEASKSGKYVLIHRNGVVFSERCAPQKIMQNHFDETLWGRSFKNTSYFNLGTLNICREHFAVNLLPRTFCREYFHTPPALAPACKLSDPNLTPLPTHPGIKYVARTLAATCHEFK